MSLPKSDQIRSWTNDKLSSVYRLLFVENFDPTLDETREEVDHYLYCVNSEYEKRGLNITKPTV